MDSKLCCSIEDKSLILTSYTLFQTSPKDITPEARQKLTAIKETLYQFRQDKSLPIDKRQESFDLQQKIHEILGINKMDEKYRPKEGNNQNKGSWSATAEQRIKNCDALQDYLKNKLKVWDSLSPYEQGTLMARAWGTYKQ